MLKIFLLLLIGLSNLPTTTPCVAEWGQCGGREYRGSTHCCAPSTCHFSNPWYSQCLQGKPQQAQSPSSRNDGGQTGVTTRYWDCCKASCGWAGKAAVTGPVQTCAKDGVTRVNVNTESGCNGGSAFMCNNQQPWSVSSTLSYGYAAAHISSNSERDWCCACYSLVFTSGPVIGKRMIVQVTNTGGDLGKNHFDIQMPGGGVGVFDGCSNQFGSPLPGARYGGINSRSDCDRMPAALRSGCYWRFDWFQNADNPTIKFKKVDCPAALRAKTQCARV